MMKRTLDLLIAVFLLILFAVPILLIGILIKLTSKGPILYWSDRVGIENRIFKMVKFRTMEISTPTVATHLLKNPDNFLTKMGNILRKTSIDELPQLVNIIKGDMSFVGPRPALFNQYDLIELRIRKNMHKLKPGITGWAQINGRDELKIPQKVEFDEYYLNNQTLFLDIKIIFISIIKVMQREGVHH